MDEIRYDTTKDRLLRAAGAVILLLVGLMVDHLYHSYRDAKFACYSKTSTGQYQQVLATTPPMRFYAGTWKEMGERTLRLHEPYLLHYLTAVLICVLLSRTNETKLHAGSRIAVTLPVLHLMLASFELPVYRGAAHMEQYNMLAVYLVGMITLALLWVPAISHITSLPFSSPLYHSGPEPTAKGKLPRQAILDGNYSLALRQAKAEMRRAPEDMELLLCAARLCAKTEQAAKAKRYACRILESDAQDYIKDAVRLFLNPLTPSSNYMTIRLK